MKKHIADIQCPLHLRGQAAINSTQTCLKRELLNKGVGIPTMDEGNACKLGSGRKTKFSALAVMWMATGDDSKDLSPTGISEKTKSGKGTIVPVQVPSCKMLKISYMPFWSCGYKIMVSTTSRISWKGLKSVLVRPIRAINRSRIHLA